MPGSFDFRESVRRFLIRECSPAEQDAFYRQIRRLREDPGKAILESKPVLDARLVPKTPKGEYAVVGKFEFGCCEAVYSYFPRRLHVEVIKCRRLKPDKNSGSHE